MKRVFQKCRSGFALTLFASLLSPACSPAVNSQSGDPGIWKERIELHLGKAKLADSGKTENPLDISMSEEDRIVRPVPVADDDPVWGDPAAPVTVVVYSDFECPFCSRHEQNVTEIKKKYGKLVRLVFKQFPLSFHSHAMSAAMASLAAHQQGKFWPMHDQLFDRTGMTDEDRLAWAEKHGIDFKKIVAAVESGDLARRVQRDIAEGKEMGVQGTPATFVNGVLISGAVPLATLNDAVDLGLARAYVLLNKGVAPEHVYRRLTGQKTPPR